MKRFPELKPNFWDVIVVLAVIALAALSAMTVWRGGTETGALTAVVTADGQEIDRFAPADLHRTSHAPTPITAVTLTVAAEDETAFGSVRRPTVPPRTASAPEQFPAADRASCACRPGSSFSSPAARRTDSGVDIVIG